MRLIIAGGRDYVFGKEEFDWLIDLSYKLGGRELEVVSGTAAGADTCGEMWAKMRLVPVKRFPANWRSDGHRAGFIRNEQMAEYADALALFPGGRGSQDMLTRALHHGLKVFRYKP